jgi:hypothetical protein
MHVMQRGAGCLRRALTCSQQTKCYVDALIGLECIVTVLTRCDQCSMTLFDTLDLGSATLYCLAEGYTIITMCH